MVPDKRHSARPFDFEPPFTNYMIATDDRKTRLQDAIARKGMRYTKQREHVFNILMDKRDHPTADEVFVRARRKMPSISCHCI